MASVSLLLDIYEVLTLEQVTVYTPPANVSSHTTSYGRTLILNQVRTCQHCRRITY